MHLSTVIKVIIAFIYSKPFNLNSNTNKVTMDSWIIYIKYYGVYSTHLCNDIIILLFSLHVKLQPHHYWGLFNTLRQRQNGRHFADDTFKPIFLNENIQISIKISLKFVPKVPINNIPSLVQIMAWRRPGDKPLSEPMMVCLLTHICVTRPQWVNKHNLFEISRWLKYLPQNLGHGWVIHISLYRWISACKT